VICSEVIKIVTLKNPHILNKKHELWFNITLKAVVIGASFYVERRLAYIFKRTGRQMPYRYEIFMQAVRDEVTKRWRKISVSSIVLISTAKILVYICALDPAYGLMFNKIMRSYHDRLKKSGVKL